MKINIPRSLVLLLVSSGTLINANAQVKRPVLTDNLFEYKTTLLSKYLPAEAGRLENAAYQLPAKTFLLKLGQFKKAAGQSIAKEKSPALKSLMTGDVNAYSMMQIDEYKNNYGLDTVKQGEFYKLINAHEADPAYEKKIREASDAMYTKQLSAADLKQLEAAGQPFNFNNDLLFKRSDSYRRVIEHKVRQALEKQYNEEMSKEGAEDRVKLALVKKLVTNQFIRDYYTYDGMQNFFSTSKNTGLAKKLYDEFLPQVKEPSYAADITKTYNNFINYANGKPAPDFSYQDVNGKTVSLKDLRGKYVYIDIWATWCVPCKQEIPALTKMEALYKDKNIHFVSISVDKTASHALWKSYVLDNKLKGFQLITDKDIKSGFIASFNINYIPRFILIDPEGNIKDSNAKRPSDPELGKELDQLLHL